MARRKKSDTEAHWLKLTDKQAAFTHHMASGKSQIDAYKLAYNCENMSDPAIRVNASRLRHQPNVALILDQLASDRFNAATCAKEDHLKELARLAKRAETAGNFGAAVQAEQLRGKVAGHYVEQSRDVTERDPMEALDELAKLAPDIARKLAEQEGIPWKPSDSETKH